jgi:DNA end-binding protein Ku
LPRRKRRAAPATGDEHPVGRGLWSGTLTFGLVTIPVELYAATRSSAPGLRMLAPDGAPLARRYVCPEEGRELADDEIERGYEVERGKFVVVTEQELERIAPRRSRDIELIRFVDREALDPMWFVRPYFLLPGAGQTKAYRLLADTMESTARAALASFVMRGKGYAVAIFADRGVLRAETLRFRDELRTPEQVGLPAKSRAEPARVARMERAIDALAEKALDPEELRDDAADRLLAVARRKERAGKDVFEAPEPEDTDVPAADESAGAEVVDLAALIRERLRAGPAERRPKRTTRARRPRKAR